jgi:Secretion system C-terminal sorting domain
LKKVFFAQVGLRSLLKCNIGAGGVWTVVPGTTFSPGIIDNYFTDLCSDGTHLYASGGFAAAYSHGLINTDAPARRYLACWDQATGILNGDFHNTMTWGTGSTGIQDMILQRDGAGNATRVVVIGGMRSNTPNPNSDYLARFIALPSNPIPDLRFSYCKNYNSGTSNYTITATGSQGDSWILTASNGETSSQTGLNFSYTTTGVNPGTVYHLKRTSINCCYYTEHFYNDAAITCGTGSTQGDFRTLSQTNSNSSQLSVAPLRDGLVDGELSNSPVEKLLIYPNPSDGTFRIMANFKNTAPVQLTVMDIMGQQITAKQINSFNSNGEELDMSSQPNGTYLVTLKQGNKIVTQTIIKE